jgi:hypothetical protein
MQPLFAQMEVDASVSPPRDCEQCQLKLARSAQMWITEGVFGVGQQVKNGVISSEDMAAAFVARAFISARASLAHKNSVDGAMGLRGNDGKKASRASRTMTKQVGKYTVLRQVDHLTGVRPNLFRA